MEVKEAPPKTHTSSGDGSDKLKVIVASRLPLKKVNKPDEAMQHLREAMRQAGTELLGASISRIVCTCPNNCQGTIYGMIAEDNTPNRVTFVLFAALMAGDLIETTDPSLVPGEFVEVL